MPKVKSPIISGWQVSDSLDASDNQLINLYLKFIETKDGVVPAWLALTPGLDLVLTVGPGPIRACHVLNTTLYVVSATNVYSVSSTGIITLLGSITLGGTAPVSMFDNGFQMMLVDGTNAYLAPGGYPMTGGPVAVGGATYAVGDTITLKASTGTQTSYPIITVATESGGVVETYKVTQGGSLSVNSGVTFTQKSTSGSGSGFEITAPTFGAFVNLVQITVPFAQPVAGGISDGFGLLVFANSQNIAQSDELDLSTWDPLSYGVADESPDNCVSLSIIHDQVYVLKERNTEVWADAGTAGFAFAPLQGVHTEFGCAAPFSPAKAGEDLCWLSQNAEGQGIVVRARGYNIEPISSQDLVRVFQTYATIADAIGYAYQISGHLFYVLTFPTANVTWSCDLTSSGFAGAPVWHQLASFSNGLFNRHLGNCYTRWHNGLGQPNIGVLGDYSSGNLYVYNPATLTDAGTPRKWLRTWRAKAGVMSEADRYTYLWIKMQTGAGMAPGAAPHIMLRWSDDGGHSWSDFRIMSVGQLGDSAVTVKANRLGGTRRFQRSNRMFELSSADPFMTAILGAEVEYT